MNAKGVQSVRLVSAPSKSLLSSSSVSAVYSRDEYMYLAVLDGNAVDSFQFKNVKSLDAFIHIQPNFVYHLFSVSGMSPNII